MEPIKISKNLYDTLVEQICQYGTEGKNIRDRAGEIVEAAYYGYLETEKLLAERDKRIERMSNELNKIPMADVDKI